MTWEEHYSAFLLTSLNWDSLISKLAYTRWGFYCWIWAFMAIVVKKTIQSNSNYPVSKRITKISLVFAAWPQATWRQNKVLKWRGRRGGAHSDVFPCQEIGGPSGLKCWTKEFELTLVTQWAMCPTAWSTKGVSQVILHMLLSGFFNTCSFCFCHPALHGDINLWLADSQAQVSAYKLWTHQNSWLSRKNPSFFFSFKTNICQVFFFFLLPSVEGQNHYRYFSSFSIVLIVTMNKT